MYVNDIKMKQIELSMMGGPVVLCWWQTMGIIRGCLKDLPTYQWLTALSQLVSRICHPNEEVVRLVKHIITTLLQVSQLAT